MSKGSDKHAKNFMSAEGGSSCVVLVYCKC